MSPVDQSRNHVGQAAAVALVSIVVLALALFATAVLIHASTKKDNSGVRLGDRTFQAGNAEKKAQLIAETGPIPYPDVSGRNERPIFLQHLGQDPEKGWYAFLAYPSTKSADCPWEWVASKEQFRAKCDHSLTLPADGEGVQQFRVTVKDGDLEVDLNADAERTTTTAQATTTTTGG